MRQLGVKEKFFAEFDMFSAPPTLRSRKQTQTSSYTSGILSFGLAIFFTYVFCIKFYKVLVYENINSTQTTTKLSGDQLSANDIFFSVGLGIGYVTLDQILPHFQFVLTITYEGSYKRTLDLVPCSLQSWNRMDNFQKLYYQYKLGQTLCPNQTQNLRLKKQYYAPNSTFMAITIKPCTNTTRQTCSDPITQYEYVKQIRDKQGSIFVVVYLLDSIIAPQDEDPVNLTVNTDSQFSFTLNRGIVGTIQLASFHINTDKGIFPVEQIIQNEGTILHSFRQTSTQRWTNQSDYAMIYLCLNRKKILIQRTVGKLDEMLSYAGGLFSIIVGFLSFFMSSYNQYRYELMVAQGVFNSDQNGNIIRQNQFSFWKYIKYTIFDWVDLIFCRELNWEDCKAIHEARQEANSHLDVTGLFRKIKNIERSLNYTLDQNQKNCLYLLKPQSLNQIRKDRLALQYFEYVLGDDSPTTIDQYRTAQSLLNFSWKLYQKSMKTNKVINLDGLQTPAQFQFGQEIQKRKSQTVKEIIEKFPQIIKAAQQLKLSQQMNQIQAELSSAFYNLSQQKRIQFQSTIPIKILVRLRKKKQQKLSQKSSSQDSSSQSLKILQKMVPKNIKIISENYGQNIESQIDKKYSTLFRYN